MPKPESSMTGQHVPHATGVPEFPTQQRRGGALGRNTPGAIDANPLAPQGAGDEPMGFRAPTLSKSSGARTSRRAQMVSVASSGQGDQFHPVTSGPHRTDEETPKPSADTGGPKDPPKDPPPTNKPVPSPGEEPSKKKGEHDPGWKDRGPEDQPQATPVLSDNFRSRGALEINIHPAEPSLTNIHGNQFAPGTIVGEFDFTPKIPGSNQTIQTYTPEYGAYSLLTLLETLQDFFGATDPGYLRPEYLITNTNSRMAQALSTRLGFAIQDLTPEIADPSQKRYGVVGKTSMVQEKLYELVSSQDPEGKTIIDRIRERVEKQMQMREVHDITDSPPTGLAKEEKTPAIEQDGQHFLRQPEAIEPPPKGEFGTTITFNNGTTVRLADVPSETIPQYLTFLRREAATAFPPSQQPFAFYARIAERIDPKVDDPVVKVALAQTEQPWDVLLTLHARTIVGIVDKYASLNRADELMSVAMGAVYMHAGKLRTWAQAAQERRGFNATATATNSIVTRALAHYLGGPSLPRSLSDKYHEIAGEVSLVLTQRSGGLTSADIQDLAHNLHTKIPTLEATDLVHHITQRYGDAPLDRKDIQNQVPEMSEKQNVLDNIYAALNTMHPQLRKAIVYKYLLDDKRNLTNDEVANLMELPKSQVGRLLSEARHILFQKSGSKLYPHD